MSLMYDIYKEEILFDYIVSQFWYSVASNS